MLTSKKILFINLYLVLLTKCKSKDYCGAKFCNNTKQHTLCKYKSEDPASTCLSYERTIFSDIDRQQLLNKINNRRNKVAAGEIRSLPSAAGMMKLQWNSELELSAQRWADQCIKHGVPDLKDTCRDLGQINVGQNIATVQGNSPGLTPMALVDVWYMQLLKFNSSIISRYVPSFEIGEPHYDYFTQLVWEDSTEVGCGGVKFQERLDVERYRAVYRLVCNFAPAGNRRNKTVYSCGAPCSACSDGICDSDYTALCADKTVVNYESNNMEINDESMSTEPSQALETTELATVVNMLYNTITTAPSNKTTEQESLPFDYIHHLFDSKILQEKKTTITGDVTNKEDLLSDFIDLLKKKLSKDVVIKDLLSPTTPGSTPLFENSFNDENVAAFINRVYSTKDIFTTVKTTAKDYVNSTLLVDLIEAVIFRNNDKLTTISSDQPDPETVPIVKPIKIQAELAEVKQNSEFTGHYFFPEEDESTKTEPIETYYDNTDIAQSDIEMEIKNLKMSSITTDFLDNIFESDSSTEKIVHIRDSTTNSKNMQRRHLYEISKSGTERIPKSEYSGKMYEKSGYNRQFTNSPIFKSLDDYEDNTSERYISYKYKDLLRKIAEDLRRLKLNEMFHCSRNRTDTIYFRPILLIFGYLKYFI